MNKQQEQAIKSLEKALARTHKVGLAIAGVDSSLVIFSYKEYRKVSWQKDRPDLAPSQILHKLVYSILMSGNYLDSGGT